MASFSAYSGREGDTLRPVYIQATVASTKLTSTELVKVSASQLCFPMS
jgi:hypothetical protein